MLLNALANSPNSSERSLSTVLSHSPLAIFLAAIFKRKIGFVTHREVRMPITKATPKAAKHSQIVIRVLASISWVKSASGTTTTISQSKPLLSWNGSIFKNCRLPSISKFNNSDFLIWFNW